MNDFISTKKELPANNNYRTVLMKNGIHICRYNKENDSWTDRERWECEVTHWSMLPNETACLLK